MAIAKTVLITGGSSGIGFELSKYFAAQGFHLCWVALDAEELDEAKKSIKRDFPEVQVYMLILT